MCDTKFSHGKQLSGANVTLLEDRPDVTEKVIQISGTPEQAERAQSLLQGFILSSNSLPPSPPFLSSPLLSSPSLSSPLLSSVCIICLPVEKYSHSHYVEFSPVVCIVLLFSFFRSIFVVVVHIWSYSFI